VLQRPLPDDVLTTVMRAADKEEDRRMRFSAETALRYPREGRPAVLRLEPAPPVRRLREPSPTRGIVK